jgi:hypothetical protein
MKVTEKLQRIFILHHNELFLPEKSDKIQSLE